MLQRAVIVENNVFWEGPFLFQTLHKVRSIKKLVFSRSVLEQEPSLPRAPTSTPSNTSGLNKTACETQLVTKGVMNALEADGSKKQSSYSF